MSSFEKHSSIPQSLLSTEGLKTQPIFLLSTRAVEVSVCLGGWFVSVLSELLKISSSELFDTFGTDFTSYVSCSSIIHIVFDMYRILRLHGYVMYINNNQ